MSLTLNFVLNFQRASISALCCSLGQYCPHHPLQHRRWRSSSTLVVHQSDFIELGAISQWNEKCKTGSLEACPPHARWVFATKVMSGVQGLASGVPCVLHKARLPGDSLCWGPLGGREIFMDFNKPDVLGILGVRAERGSTVPNCTCMGEGSQRRCSLTCLIFEGLLLMRRVVLIPFWFALSFSSVPCEKAER